MDVDDELLDRYVSGECSPDEVTSILQWAGNDPERLTRIARVRALSDAVESLNDRWDVDRAWARAQSVVRSAEPDAGLNHPAPSLDDPGVDLDALPAALSGPRPRQRVMTRTTLAAAACLVLGLGIGTWRVLAVGRAFVSAPESIVTGPRQRVSLQLRDGSHVILGPESRLVEAAQFGTATREVDLEGAAYFDVVHDSKRPFVVVAHNLRVRDLGTRFSVDAYTSNPSAPDAAGSLAARIAVAAGSVAIESISPDASTRLAPRETLPTTASSIILGAGSVGRIDERGRISIDQPTNLGQYVSWTSGTLTLDDATLGEAATRLEHWYGVTIRLGDPSLACRHITAAFHDEPLTDALDELSLALHLRHTDAGGTVTLVDPGDRPDAGAHGNGQPVASDVCDSRAHGPAGRSR